MSSQLGAAELLVGTPSKESCGLSNHGVLKVGDHQGSKPIICAAQSCLCRMVLHCLLHLQLLLLLKHFTCGLWRGDCVWEKSNRFSAFIYVYVCVLYLPELMS